MPVAYLGLGSNLDTGRDGLGRVFGPMYAGVAFAQLGTGSPYLIGALLMLPCVLLSIAVVRRPAPA